MMNECHCERFIHQPARRLTTVLWALCTAAAVAAPVYKATDQDGHIAFTDQPPVVDAESAEQHKIRPLNIAEPIATKAVEPASIPAEVTIPSETRIEQPADGSTLPMGPGKFAVTVSVSPPLTDSEHLQLEMNGVIYGAAQKQRRWSLSNIYRGKHQLRVHRLDNSGGQVNVSETRTLLVLRPSVAR